MQERVRYGDGQTMVDKYVIMCGGTYKNWETPRQLSIINNEKLVERTIRLLKENGVNDIVITTNSSAFEGLGVPVIYYDCGFVSNGVKTLKGYWLDAFDFDLLNQPVCFLFGDVYYSDNAIKQIVETPTDSTLFFCSYQNHSKEYIKEHDEPLGYKVVDYELFKKHINIVKDMKDKGLCCREPIVWELYRSINGLPINEHTMTNNYIAINDISCDIDGINDIKKIEVRLGGEEMIKVEVIEDFTLERFDEIVNLERKSAGPVGRLKVGDIFECQKDLADYLLGENRLNRPFVKVIEVIPAKKEPVVEKTEPEAEAPTEAEIKPKKEFKKKKKSTK